MVMPDINSAVIVQKKWPKTPFIDLHGYARYQFRYNCDGYLAQQIHHLKLALKYRAGRKCNIHHHRRRRHHHYP